MARPWNRFANRFFEVDVRPAAWYKTWNLDDWPFNEVRGCHFVGGCAAAAAVVVVVVVAVVVDLEGSWRSAVTKLRACHTDVVRQQQNTLKLAFDNGE